MPPRPGLFNQPITLRRRGATTRDEYGDEVASAGEAVQVRGYLEQSSSLEQLDGRDQTVTSWRLFLPAGTTITALDTVEFDGNTWQVVGNPEAKWNPRSGRVEYIKAELIAVQSEQ